jgi:hypothetical protein
VIATRRKQLIQLVSQTGQFKPNLADSLTQFTQRPFVGSGHCPTTASLMARDNTRSAPAPQFVDVLFDFGQLPEHLVDMAGDLIETAMMSGQSVNTFGVLFEPVEVRHQTLLNFDRQTGEAQPDISLCSVRDVFNVASMVIEMVVVACLSN